MGVPADPDPTLAGRDEDVKPQPGGIAAVILAAGMSRRLPGKVPKQLLEVEGEALIHRTLRIVLEAAPSARTHVVRIVLGHQAPAIRQAIDDLLTSASHRLVNAHRLVNIRCLVNDDYAQGQSTSIRCAVQDLTTTPEVEGAFFLPADQPWIDSSLLCQLQAAHRRGYGKIIVPTHRGRRGAPVLFDHTFFPQLLKLQGDQGGRTLLQQHREHIHWLELTSSRPLEDIDTPEDLARLASKLTEHLP